MRFWDSSAAIPLVFKEPTSESLDYLLSGETEIAVWWGTWAECAVTISRLKRDGVIDEETEQRTRAAAFVCLDDRLRRAAEDEGFSLSPGPPIRA